MSTSVWHRRVGDVAIIMSLVLLAAFLCPLTALAHESRNVVRVGWYESPFNTTGDLGRRSGYAYDYQQKIAAYTGWTYEYVRGSWPELLQMLEDGRIDLMSDVSYTDERAERMLFSSLPMGSEEYYLYAAPGNEGITADDYSTLDGKKIGANKGSVQIGCYREWAKANGVKAQIEELTGTEESNLKKLASGAIDLYLSLDGFFDKEVAVPVCRVGVSDFYFVVSKSRPELLVELNNAMNRVQGENQYYNQQLYAKYLQTSSVNNFLNAKEKAWLEEHGAIRVGYQDNYLAFCAKDPNTGELTGALKECLDVVSDGIENADVSFEPVCYATAAAAVEAMKSGDVDCVFPANLSEYDGEVRGVFMTPALMHTDMSAIIRSSEQMSFSGRERVTVAVNKDNPNYDMFLLDHFPEWRAIYYADTQECLKAVADGQADCVLISNYRYNNIARLCEKYELATWSTGVQMDYCFAVDRSDTELYSILSKATAVVPTSTVNAALTQYFTEDARVSIFDALGEVVIGVVVCVLTVAALIVIIVLVRNAWSERKDGRRRRVPVRKDFALFDDLPFSYSVYHVAHDEHSELYNAEIIYANEKFSQLGGLPVDALVGRRMRELYPHLKEGWYQDAKRAAIDGEVVERDHVDSLSGKELRYTFQQVISSGYCAVTNLEV